MFFIGRCHEDSRPGRHRYSGGFMPPAFVVDLPPRGNATAFAEKTRASPCFGSAESRLLRICGLRRCLLPLMLPCSMGATCGLWGVGLFVKRTYHNFSDQVFASKGRRLGVRRLDAALPQSNTLRAVASSQQRDTPSRTFRHVGVSRTSELKF